MRGELVEAASIAVVAAMDTDAWQAARARLAGLFGRGRPIRQARYEAALDENSGQVAEAENPTEMRESLVPVWAQELQTLLRRHPDATAELRAFAAEVPDALPPAQQDWLHSYRARQQANH